MSDITVTTAELEAALHRYLDAYFARRDLKSTLVMFHPDITGIGTGLDELGFSFAEFAHLYARDLTEAPNPIEYTLLRTGIHVPLPMVGVVMCMMNIRTLIANQELKLNHLRLSLTFVKMQTGWLIAHMHISFPTVEHESQEAYPLKELEERNRLLERLVDEKTSALSAALGEIRQLAVTDKLTGLCNRARTDELLEQELHRAQRTRQAFAAILVDIDHFKAINDHYGHLTGDRALSAFAQRMTERLRQTDFAGRWGGEEFLILCPATNLAGAMYLAQDIRQRVQDKPFGEIGNLTASFGVAAFVLNDTPHALMARVDDALYRAKRSGRNCVIADE